MAKELFPELDSAETFALFCWDVENSVGGEALQFAAWLESVFDCLVKPSEFWTELAAEIEAEAAKVPAAVAAAYAKEDSEQAEAGRIYAAEVAERKAKEAAVAVAAQGKRFETAMAPVAAARATKKSEVKVGDRRYQTQVWQESNGKWNALIRVSKRVRFQSSGRVGWKSLGWTVDKFSEFDTYEEARDAARKVLREYQAQANR